MSALTAPHLSQVLKLALQPFAPLQRMVDPPSDVHDEILVRALIFLQRHQKQAIALFFAAFQDDLHQGMIWADKSWKNIAHYCRATSIAPKSNLWPTAKEEATVYFEKAKYHFTTNIRRSFFFLGSSLHILQDMAVPHHARGILLDGHQEFEKYVKLHLADLPDPASGWYASFTTLDDWLIHTARKSSAWFPFVSLAHGASESSFALAANELFPLAVRTTAGFLVFAFQVLNVLEHTSEPPDFSQTLSSWIAKLLPSHTKEGVMNG